MGDAAVNSCAVWLKHPLPISGPIRAVSEAALLFLDRQRARFVGALVPLLIAGVLVLAAKPVGKNRPAGLVQRDS